MKDSLKIRVLMGGPSAEHEISLRSGQGVVEALIRRGWSAQAIVIPQDLTIEEASRYVRLALEQGGSGLVFIALHGPFGEDGTIQRVCEELHLIYTGSDTEASRLGLDKVASRRRFEQAGLRVPRWQLVDPAPLVSRSMEREESVSESVTKYRTQSPSQRGGDDPTTSDGLERVVRGLRFPVVVKPTNQGSSIGVSIAAHHGEFWEALEEASRYDARILIEEFVRGRELTVGILGRHALPIVEIRPRHRFFDYTAKYTPGITEYVVPAILDAQLAAQIQEAGLCAHRALGCRHFSRVDLILNEEHQPVILELNTIPGLTAMSLLPKAAACVGISYDELCERLVLMALPQREESIVHATESIVRRP